MTYPFQVPNAPELALIGVLHRKVYAFLKKRVKFNEISIKISIHSTGLMEVK